MSNHSIDSLEDWFGGRGELDAFDPLDLVPYRRAPQHLPPQRHDQPNNGNYQQQHGNDTPLSVQVSQFYQMVQRATAFGTKVVEKSAENRNHPEQNETASSELAFTRKLQQQLASISSYYMGFYIHSCPKMRYKSNLSPSFLLCPEVYSWHPLDQRVIGLLDRSKYSRLNEDPAAEDGNRTKAADVRNVLILHGSSYQRYSSYLKEIGSPELEENVITYAKLVGKVCSSRMLLYEG